MHKSSSANASGVLTTIAICAVVASALSLGVLYCSMYVSKNRRQRASAIP